MHSVNVSHNLSRTELEKESERINRDISSRVILTFIPRTKITSCLSWKLRSRIIQVQRDRGYMEEGFELGLIGDATFFEGQRESYLLGFLLPNRKVFLDIREFDEFNLQPYDSDFDFSKLNALGYKRVQSKGYFAFNLNYEDNGSTWEPPDENILRLQRRLVCFPALDERAMKILEIIDQKVGDPNAIYRFVLFEVGCKLTTQESRNCPGMKEEDYKDVEITWGLRKYLNMTSQEVKQGKLEKIAKKMGIRKALGINSKVIIGRNTFHIPMIDFRPGLTPVEYATQIKQDLNKYKIGMDGLIVNSGDSGHFYGFQLLSQREWEQFMKKSHNFWFADRNFLRIQRKRGSTTLRLTPTLEKMTQPCLYDIYTN